MKEKKKNECVCVFVCVQKMAWGGEYRVIAVDMGETDFGGVFKGAIRFSPTLKGASATHLSLSLSLLQAEWDDE